MKKEPSKGWLEFRARAGEWLRAAGRQLRRLLAAVGRRIWAWLKASFRLERGRALAVLRDGLLARNPLLVLTLGATCALAATADLKSAVTMGCCTLCVLLCSELLVSLLRHVIPEKARRVCALMIVGAFTTAAGMLLRLTAPLRAEDLGLYLLLIAVNCMVLSRAAGFACENTPGYALLDALSNGLGYGLALAVLGAVREVLGSGSLWGVSLFGAQFHPALLIAAPCGGFLTLGLLTALAQWIRNLSRRKGGGEA